MVQMPPVPPVLNRPLTLSHKDNSPLFQNQGGANAVFISSGIHEPTQARPSQQPTHINTYNSLSCMQVPFSWKDLCCRDNCRSPRWTSEAGRFQFSQVLRTVDQTLIDISDCILELDHFINFLWIPAITSKDQIVKNSMTLYHTEAAHTYHGGQKWTNFSHHTNRHLENMTMWGLPM